MTQDVPDWARELIDKVDGLATKEDVDALAKQVDTLSGQVGNLRGREAEREVQDNILSLVDGYLGQGALYIQKSYYYQIPSVLRGMISVAVSSGVIEQEQAGHIYSTDCILSGTINGAYTYVMAEISTTIDDKDIIRARDRAQAIKEVTRSESVPVVIGGFISARMRKIAENEGVRVIVSPEMERLAVGGSDDTE